MSDRWNDLISTNEMARRANISYRMLDHWVRENLVVPAIAAQGSGTSRRWYSWQIGQVIEERHRTQLVHVKQGER